MPGRDEDGSGGVALYAIAPTLFTPGDPLGVDLGAMADAVSWMVDQHVPDVLLTGSYGEFQSLTDDERVDVVRAVRGVGGVRSVMACAVSTSTAGTVTLGRRQVDAGADLVMVAAPVVSEVSPSEVRRHFAVAAERIPAPLVVYNNPVFGRDLSPEELEDVVEGGAFRAVKQGTHSLRALAASVSGVHRASGGRTRVLAASDLTGAAALFAGADGLTSTNSWAFPGAIAAIVGAARSGEWATCRGVAAALEPYFALTRRLGQPRTVKGAMTHRGLPGGGRVRLPYVPLDADERAELERVVEKCDAELGALGVDPMKPVESRAGTHDEEVRR